MPTDIELFDMLRPNVLEAMTLAQLKVEVERICRMHARVQEYERDVLYLVRQRLLLEAQTGK